MTMFPIVAPRLEDLAPALQTLLLATVNAAQPQARPFLLHTPGTAGADKSALITTLTQSLKSRKPVIVAFDRMLDVLPGYQEAAAIDTAAASTRYELQARAAGYRLLQMLLEKRANIIFDHNGANAQQVALLRYVTATGYKVGLLPNGITTPAENDELLPACKALGITLYELTGEDNDDSGAHPGTNKFTALSQKIAQAV